MESTTAHIRSAPASAREKAGQWLILLGLLGLLAALFQHYSSWGVTERFTMGPSQRMEPDGLTYRTKASGLVMTRAQEQGLVVLEDGKPLGRMARSMKDATLRGGGWYVGRVAVIRFAPGDETDPRTNGRKYEAQVPMEVRPVVWGGILTVCGLGLLLTRGKVKFSWIGASRALFTRRPVLQTWGFFFLFWALRAFQIHADPDFTDGVMSLKGVPESDAGGWHNMGTALAEGRGFDSGFASQRPVYSVMLGLCHQIFGAHIGVSLGLNSFLHAVAGTAILVLGGLLGSRVLGVVTALWVLLAQEQDALSKAIMTENAGLAFGALSLLAFWVAVRRRSMREHAAAGLIVGFGNLASGVFLLAVPIYPIVMTVYARWQRWSWRQWVGCALAFVLGVSLVFVPWLIRQKVKYDVMMLAPNTSELLYGGAHPDEGKLSRKILEDAANDGMVGAPTGVRYKYFLDRYKETVKEDPVRYLRQLGKATMTAAESTPRSDAVWHWLTRWMIVLGAVVGCMRRRSFLPILPAIFLYALLPWLATVPWLWCLLGASFLVMFQTSRRVRLGWVLVIASTLSTLFLMALSGNVATGRFLCASDWLMFFLWCGGLQAAQRLLSAGLIRLVKRPARDDATGTESLSMGINRAVFCRSGVRWGWQAAALVGCACILACATTLAAYGWRQMYPWQNISLTPEDKQALAQHVISQHSSEEVKTIPAERLWVAVVELDDRRARLRGKESLGSMTWGFGKRDYTRWVAGATRLDGHPPRSEEISIQAPGDFDHLPWNAPVVVVGVWHQGHPRRFGEEALLLELLAAYPTVPGENRNTVKADLNQQLWFRYTVDTARALRKAPLDKP